ncbi:hypothetical protein PCAR4_110078 [Paraburkholderia caribensis]|nr:hypothetical protein PCAR4_110078 [Paraburkholderia caribensis]
MNVREREGNRVNASNDDETQAEKKKARTFPSGPSFLRIWWVVLGSNQ